MLVDSTNYMLLLEPSWAVHILALVVTTC